MPFTFAHPSLVVPLKKWNKRFSLTGLIIGSMAPDFEFFFRMRVGENVGHHGYGILWFDIPMGLLLCYGFHNLVRNPLIENLPDPLRSKFQNLLNFNFNKYSRENFLNLVISISIGVFSHVLWDGFTHFDGGFVILIPFLGQNFWILGKYLPVYFLLQVVFSLLGLGAMYRYIQKIPLSPKTIPSGEDKMIYWTLLLAITFYILMVRLILWPQYQSFWDVFMAIMGSGLWALGITSFIIKRNLKIKWPAESQS